METSVLAPVASSASSTFSFDIATELKPRFEKKVAHLNRLLAKMGKDPITFKYTNVHVREVPFTIHTQGEAFANDEVHLWKVEFCTVECEGLVTVKKDDKEYRYLGSVKFDDIGVKQVFCNDDKYARYFMDDFRDGMCDHCHSRRTNRKSYYLFLADDNVVQIGSTCAKEFFGIASAAFLDCQLQTFTCAYYDEELAEMLRGGSVPRAFSFNEIVNAYDVATSAFMHWVKRANANEFDRATTDVATSILCKPFVEQERGMCEFTLTREEIHAFWKARYEERKDTFSYNCMCALEADGASIRNLGSYGYAIFGAYNARVQENVAKAVQSGVAPCPYEKDSRATIKGTVVSCRAFESEECYDGWHYVSVTKYSVNFKGENGTLYHFTTQSEGFDSVRSGDAILVRGTIGETRPYKGVDYTVLRRPRVTEEKPAKATRAKKRAAASAAA